MSEFNRDQTVYVNEQAGLKDYIVGVFTKMGIALLITAASAYGLYASNLIGRMAMSSPGILSMLYMLAIAVEFGIVIYLSSRLTTMSTNTATGLFYGYAVVTGLTFSTLFYAYDASTIAISFLFTAVVFFSCAIIGRFTNVDLSRFSGIMMGGLVALILVSILGIINDTFVSYLYRLKSFLLPRSIPVFIIYLRYFIIHMNAINRETVQQSVQFLLIEKVNLNISFQPVCLIVKRLKASLPGKCRNDVPCRFRVGCYSEYCLVIFHN